MDSPRHSSATSTEPPYPTVTQPKPISKPRRPCDACRKRKSRCEIQEPDVSCVLCIFHRQECLFTDTLQPRKRRKISESAVDSAALSGTKENATPLDPSADSMSVQYERRSASVNVRRETTVDDYANLKGPSLLKRTLGLQNHRHSKILGLTSVFEPALLSLPAFDTKDEISLGSVSVRKVTGTEGFLLLPDTGTTSHADELHDLDAIEALVAPHGSELVRLYFRIVHPTFPILHKRVFLEKYGRTRHREFSPPLLAAVYLLATGWWSYSAELGQLALPRPDTAALEALALRTMAYVVQRPKLSTIQAGLLLLQRPEGESWALTGKLVALGQDLGLHLDCSRWRIPAWEKGLRKRLGWALFMQDKWGALIHGRPSHLTADDWMLKPVTEADFPERAADEDDEEGSTEVEKGRMLFSEMIKLTEILSNILAAFYTLRAEEEFRSRHHEGGRWVLEKAKPMQLELKEWFAQLPLKMDIRMKKLNSTGYLYLAYYATEITLHRRIVRSLQHEPDASLVHICRSAARARLTSATEFVRGLRAEHLQSFWYSASKYGFALVGSFIGLLWATAADADDAEDCRRRLDEYRWMLRLSSKSAEMLDRAAGLLATSTAVLIKGIPSKAPEGEKQPAQEENASEEEEETEETWPLDQGLQDDLSMGASPVEYPEGPMDLFFHDDPMSRATTYASLGRFNESGTLSTYANNDDVGGF